MPDIEAMRQLRREVVGWLSEAGRRLVSQEADQLRRRAESKGHGDFVTPLEHQLEGLLYNGISHSEYAGRVIAEESFQGGEPDLSRGGCWTIDPLDSTAGYLFQAGPTVPSIMLAYCFDGITQVSGIHFPFIPLTVSAIRGEDLIYTPDDEHLPRHISSSRYHVKLAEAWVDINHYADSQYRSKLVQQLEERLRSTRGAALVTSQVPHSGIVLSLITGTPNISAVVHENNPARVKQAIWDVLPAQLILERAGGYMMGLESGGCYNALRPEPFVAAVSEQLAKQIFELANTV